MHIDNNQFSSREKETIDLLLQGKSNKQIALALGVSVSTVEFHLKNVYRKLQVRSRTEAILQLGASTGSDETSKQRQSTGSTADKQRESTVDGIDVRVENDGNTIPKRRISMKQRFYIIGGTLLVIVLATAIVFARLSTANTHIPPTNTLEASGTTIPLMSGMGTSFIFPPGLGDGTENEIVPQSNGFSVWPKHIKITLVDYPLESTALKPQILVFPLKEYRQMDMCPEAMINGLENILKAQHISLAEPLPCVSVADSLPFLPDLHAAQVFHAQEKFLSFKNGTGIRYITEYSQAAFPAINNTDMFYTFQGLTSDGMYYVSVILPLNLASLDGIEAPENADKYPDYLNTTRDLLNRADNPFSPSLESLDALAQSLLIAWQQ